MAANEDHLPPPCFTFTNTALDCLPDVPFIPSVEEAQHRYYGLPSQPYFVVHSSHDIWVMPTGIETYIQLKELHCISEHALCNIWEGSVDTIMHNLLVKQKVHYMSLDPVHIGIVNESAAPVIIWVRVKPGSLSAEYGIKVTIGLRAITCCS
jgi:hypothetical protein